MKNSLLIVLSLLFVFNSCKKNEDSVLKIDDNQSTLNLSITNASSTLNLTSNVSWKITSDNKWCTFSDSIGNGNKGIVVSCTDNLTGLDREAKVTIEGGGLSQSVIVKQTGGTKLFEDDFSSNVNNWGTLSDTLSYKVTGGYFNVKNTCTATTWSFAPRDVIASKTDNFVVNIVYNRVTATGGFGITLGGSDWDNLYRIILNSNSYSVQIKTNNVYASLIYTTNCSFKSTGNNTLRVVKMNDKCDIYINDLKINSFNITPYGTKIAFYLSVLTEVNVDYMCITKI